MTNPTRRTFVEIHALQELPSNCINRDDTGAPKEANIGGTRRARVSSQAWKKVVRQYLRENVEINLTKLTKKQAELVAPRVSTLLPDLSEEDVRLLVNDFFVKDHVPGIAVKYEDEKTKEGYVVSRSLFASTEQELQIIAEHIAQIDNSLSKAEVASQTKTVAASLKDVLTKEDKVTKKRKINSSYENALFGRMAASENAFNVDASCQFAHAIGTHPLIPEVDFYTAVDDVAGPHSGSSMIGDIEFNSSLLYRYANIDVDGLNNNLQGSSSPEELAKIVSTFITGFYETMPAGKQSSIPGRTRPNVIVVTVGESQPFVLTTLAFSNAVNGIDRVGDSSAKLATAITRSRSKYELKHDNSFYFELDEEQSRIPTTIGTEVNSISALTSSVAKAVQERLENQ